MKIKEIIEWIICILVALILAILFRYFVGTPTIVQHESMYPTLLSGERLWLNRWDRTIGEIPERGDIITFEEPSVVSFTKDEINQENSLAIYEEKGAWEWFVEEFLEIGKRSYIKRVIALPGEHVEIKQGAVYIDGEKLEESYLQPGVVTDILGETGFDDFIVPEGTVFTMGDNRSHSTDSRAFGCVPLEEIESTVSTRIWPLDKWGNIE